MRARANGLRVKAACSALGSGMSSTKAPSPLSNFGSMLRSMRAPNVRVDMSLSPSGPAKQLGGAAHGGDDVDVSGAAAKVAREHGADAVIGEIERHRLLEARQDVHHHSRRAVAALQ